MAGFKISGKDNTEVLLAGGGSKALSDFATATALSGYLPLSGGTITGNLTIKKSDPRIYFCHIDTYISGIGANTTYGLWILNRYNTSSWESHYINLKDQLYFDNKYPFIHSGNISSYAITSHQSLANYLPLSGGTMKSNAYIGFDNDAAAFRMQVGADTSTSPLRGITTPTVGGRWIGIFARPGKSTDEGGFLLSQEGAAIYNSFDSGFGFKVVDTDANLNDWNSADSVVFSVKSDNTVYSKGGFVKKDSSNSYVLLGGGGHKAVSDFLRRNIITVANNITYDANTYTNSDVLYESSGDVASGHSGVTWSNFPTSSAPSGGFSLFNIQEGGYCKQLFSSYGNSHFYVRYQYYNNGKTWSNWSTVATTSDIPTKTSQLTNDSGFLTSHQSLANYLPLSGGVLTGHLYLNSGANLVTNSTGNYANGIRINRASTSNWAGMTIGYVSSNTSSGASGSDSHTWMIATPAGSDYLNISNNGNTGTGTGLTLKGQGNNDIVWNNNVIVHSGNISSYAITSHQSLANYVTLNGDQTITGAKTFNGTKFILAGNESNEILNIYYNNGLYYKYDDSAALGSSVSIRNALRFRWYNDYWVIGNIRSGNTGTYGFGISLLNSDGSHLLDRFRVNRDGTGYLNGNQIITTANIGSYTGIRIADALGAGGAPITTSVNNSAVTNSYYILATTSSGSCGWYQLPSTAFSDNNTTYSAGTGLTKDGNTFKALVATNTLLGVTKYVKYYSAASVKRYNGDVGGSEVDTSTTANIELAYASSTSGRFYPVLVDKNGFPFVNIPWSDTNTTYTFTTSGSGNVLTGVSTSGTTITFTKGNVSSGSTYGVVSNSENGLAPKVISTNTASIGSAYYVLASTNGSTSPSWYKLPSTAFSDSNSWRPVLVDGASISSNTLNLKHGTNISLSRSNGDVTITASSQFLVVSSLPSGSSITSGVLYLVTT